MPDDDIDSYWEGLRPRRESSRPPAERVEIPSPSRVIPFVASPQPVSPPIQQARPPHGLIDRHNPDAGLSTIRSLRQSLQARALDGPPRLPRSLPVVILILILGSGVNLSGYGLFENLKALPQNGGWVLIPGLSSSRFQ